MNESLCQTVPKGNTNTFGNNNAVYRWFFTLKYEEMELCQLFQILDEISKEFYFSGELSKEGYKHWQGCFSLITKERFSTVKNHFPNTIHLEQCLNWFKSIKYCSKADTHIEGPYNKNSVFIETIKDLWEWQETIKNECLVKPDNRTINWIYDKKGNQGKTEFCIYMDVKYNAHVMANGATRDLAHALPKDPKIVLLDFCRSNEEKINYGVIEGIKNGYIFSGKYDSKNKKFPKPHLYVFANFLPDRNKLSEDRWRVREIRDRKLYSLDEDNMSIVSNKSLEL